MLPVSRGLMDRDRELDAMAGVHANPGGAPAAVRGMKRGDPEPDAQTAAALVDSAGAECKRPRMDGSGGIGEVGQNNDPLTLGYHGYPSLSQEREREKGREEENNGGSSVGSLNTKVLNCQQQCEDDVIKSSLKEKPGEQHNVSGQTFAAVEDETFSGVTCLLK
ncbi:unnamed protein product [Pleuronectes platessa]|uniref:Uncharacterized protein n=1 Tax=Pleuronectes platessa TaxID=8262 RepID=A0A9N7UZE1_PLEPL|nr:unnamed protein product [Pleuronectes platessa]